MPRLTHQPHWVMTDDMKWTNKTLYQAKYSRRGRQGSRLPSVADQMNQILNTWIKDNNVVAALDIDQLYDSTLVIKVCSTFMLINSTFISLYSTFVHLYSTCIPLYLTGSETSSTSWSNTWCIETS